MSEEVDLGQISGLTVGDIPVRKPLPDGAVVAFRIGKTPIKRWPNSGTTFVELECHPFMGLDEKTEDENMEMFYSTRVICDLVDSSGKKQRNALLAIAGACGVEFDTDTNLLELINDLSGREFRATTRTVDKEKDDGNVYTTVYLNSFGKIE